MKNPAIVIISIMLSIFLFITEMLFMTSYNISNGITQQNVINIIEQVNIKNELNGIDAYKNLKQEINREILDQIFTSQEVENYIKENAKAIYINILYKENMEYISSIELKEQVNNKIEILTEQNEITEEQKEKIMTIIDELTSTIDNQIENINNENEVLQIIRIIFSKKTTNYILIAVAIIALLIFTVNKSKSGYLWTGLPTIITGVLFLILALSIEGKLPETSIDIEIKNFIIKCLPSLIKTLKKLSIIMTSIGFIECALYTILNYQERSAQDGKI